MTPIDTKRMREIFDACDVGDVPLAHVYELLDECDSLRERAEKAERELGSLSKRFQALEGALIREIGRHGATRIELAKAKLVIVAKPW